MCPPLYRNKYIALQKQFDQKTVSAAGFASSARTSEPFTKPQSRLATSKCIQVFHLLPLSVSINHFCYIFNLQSTLQI